MEGRDRDLRVTHLITMTRDLRVTLPITMTIIITMGMTIITTITTTMTIMTSISTSFRFGGYALLFYPIECKWNRLYNRSRIGRQYLYLYHYGRDKYHELSVPNCYCGSGWDLWWLLAKSPQESLTILSWDDNLPEKEFLSTCTSEVPPRGLHQKNKTSLHTTNCDMGTSLIFGEFLSIKWGNIPMIHNELRIV